MVACGSGVVRLDHVQQEALLGDAEAGEGLVQVAGVQAGAVQVHHATGVVHTVGLQAGTEGGVLVDDDILALQVVADSDFNHGMYPFHSLKKFCWFREGGAGDLPAPDGDCRPWIRRR